jgi:hypothetical protein
MGRGTCGRAACALSPTSMMKATGAVAVLEEKVIFVLAIVFFGIDHSPYFSGIREEELQLWSGTSYAGLS